MQLLWFFASSDLWLRKKLAINVQKVRVSVHTIESAGALAANHGCLRMRSSVDEA